MCNVAVLVKHLQLRHAGVTCVRARACVFKITSDDKCSVNRKSFNDNIVVGSAFNRVFFCLFASTGLEHVIQFTAIDGKVKMRGYK